MNTDIEYLKQLEVDLRDAATRESDRAAGSPGGGRPGRRGRAGWMKAAGVAAVFLIVAGAIGFIVSPTARDTFQQVGDAVASGGGDDGSAAAPSPAAPDRTGELSPTGEGLQGLEDQPVFVENVRGQRQGQLGDLSKIIRDGRIGVVVPDGAFDDTVGDVTFIAEELGGFVLSSSTQNERSGTFVLRIPAKRFDQALSEVRALGRVRFQTISGEDVTAEFIDFQARLRILQTRRAVLLGLFDQADTIPETLQLQSQLDDVQLRIEQIQGQINFINDQVAESTLRVTIQERNAPESINETEVENPDLGSSFDLAIQGFLRIVGAVIVGLGYLIPLTVLGAIVWVAVWLARRRRAAPTA